MSCEAYFFYSCPEGFILRPSEGPMGLFFYVDKPNELHAALYPIAGHAKYKQFL